MASYSRVTIVTDEKNVELVLPTAVSVGELIPQILEYTHGAPSADPRVLTLTPVGKKSIPVEESLHSAGVPAGSILRLDRRTEAVPAPIVYDLADTTADIGTHRSNVLEVEKPRILLAALTTILFSALTGLLMALVDGEDQLKIGLLCAAAPLLVLAAVGQQWRRCDLELLTPSLASTVLTLNWTTPTMFKLWLIMAAWILTSSTATLVSLRRWKVLGIFAASLVIFGLSSWGMLQANWEQDHRGLLMAVGAIIVLGMVPRLCLILSGLTAIDDRLAAGSAPSRRHVHAAIGDAHASMNGVVIVTALTTLTGIFMLDGLENDGWYAGITIVLLLLLGLRARTMPLMLERLVLLGATVIGLIFWGVRLIEKLPPWALPTAVAALLVVVIAASLVSRPAHVSATLRIAARRAEMLLTLSIFPLVLGAFGLYPQLIESFS